MMKLNAAVSAVLSLLEDAAAAAADAAQQTVTVVVVDLATAMFGKE